MEVAAAIIIGITAVVAQNTGSQSPTPKPPTVLFMCPHGAAKSVLASAYLTNNGYQVPIAKPRQVSSADLAQADEAIRKRVIQLIEELSLKQASRR